MKQRAYKIHLNLQRKFRGWENQIHNQGRHHFGDLNKTSPTQSNMLHAVERVWIDVQDLTKPKIHPHEGGYINDYDAQPNMEYSTVLRTGYPPSNQKTHNKL